MKMNYRNVFMEMFSLVLQDGTCLCILIGFSVVRMNVQILQRKEVLLKTCLKCHVLKFQMVLWNSFDTLILLAVATKFSHSHLIDVPSQWTFIHHGRENLILSYATNIWLHWNRSNQECFEEAYLPTLKTLLNAPATSPLAEVDISNVSELLVDLTRPSGLKCQSKKSQDYQVQCVRE